MNASDVVGYTVNKDGFSCGVVCNDCACCEAESKLEKTPIFAQEEGWQNWTCDSCGETLGDVEGVGT